MFITEALAELKTIERRIEKKRDFVGQYLFRQEHLKDPLGGEGGSVQEIEQARQAIADLQARAVAIRLAIAEANAINEITVCGVTKSIADWLIWRRDIAPSEQAFLRKLSNSLQLARKQAQDKGLKMVGTEADAGPQDVIVNISELGLAKQIEDLEQILGELDGQLSLKNATVQIAV